MSLETILIEEIQAYGTVGTVRYGTVRRSLIRLPQKSNNFFLPRAMSHFVTRSTNAQWEIHGFSYHYSIHNRVNRPYSYSQY